MENKPNILEELLKRKGKKTYNKITPYKSSKSLTKRRIQKLSTSNEVVIKVLSGGKFTGHGHTKQSLKSCLHYIIKGTENVTIEDHYGNEYTKSDVNNLIDKYTKTFTESSKDAKKKHRLFTHMAISLPNNIKYYPMFKNYNDEGLKKILYDVCSSTIAEKYPNNDFFIGIQDNGNNLHAHVPIICKGHDNKKIQVNPKDLFELRTKIAKKFIAYNIKLQATKLKERKPKIKMVHLEHNFKVGEVFKTKTPYWFSKHKNLEDVTITPFDDAFKKNNDFLKLEKIFKQIFRENKSSLKSFLIMHNENKSLAKWALKTQPKIFGLTKNKANIKNFEKDIQSINPNISINLNALKKSI